VLWTAAWKEAQGSIHDPAPWQSLEARIGVDPSHDLYDELLERHLVHEFSAVIGAVGEQMLDPRPALADGVENMLRACGVGNIRCRQIDHEQPSVRSTAMRRLRPLIFSPAS
jgi:hypothetical protein